MSKGLLNTRKPGGARSGEADTIASGIDARRVFGTQVVDQLLTGDAGHRQVDQHRAGQLSLPQIVDRFRAVARDDDLESFLLKELVECGARIDIVIDHQNRMRPVPHDAPSFRLT
jgi:hypothetical protein